MRSSVAIRTTLGRALELGLVRVDGLAGVLDRLGADPPDLVVATQLRGRQVGPQIVESLVERPRPGERGVGRDRPLAGHLADRRLELAGTEPVEDLPVPALVADLLVAKPVGLDT